MDMIRYHLQDVAEHPELPFHIEYGWLAGDFHEHMHDFQELMVILKGNAVHRIDGIDYEVAAGDVYVMQENTQHGFYHVRNLAYYNVMVPMLMPDVQTGTQNIAENPFSIGHEIKGMAGFQALFVLEPLYRKEHRFQNRLHLLSAQLEELDGQLRQMLNEYTQADEGFATILQAGFNTVLVKLSRWMAYPESLKTGNLRYLAEAMAKMEAHFTEELTLQSIANQAHLSSRHFSRIFSEQFGESPMAYLQRLRLRHACNLLHTKDISITQIAQICGYKDGNLFSRQFHEKLGMTPSQYRKKHG